jgi:hypothetical protein
MGTKYVTNSSRTARSAQCAAYYSQRRRNSITKDSMGENKEETGRLIKNLKETGLLYSI